MSSKNNVNPDYYRQGGRDRQGEDVSGAPRKPAERTPALRRRPPQPAPNFIPGEPPVGEPRERQEETKP